MLCELLRFSDMSLTETIVVVIRHKYIVVDMIMFLKMTYRTCFCYYVCWDIVM